MSMAASTSAATRRIKVVGYLLDLKYDLSDVNNIFGFTTDQMDTMAQLATMLTRRFIKYPFNDLPWGEIKKG